MLISFVSYADSYQQGLLSSMVEHWSVMKAILQFVQCKSFKLNFEPEFEVTYQEIYLNEKKI